MGNIDLGTQAYIFRGKCVNVVDGDTVDCLIDVGFGLRTKQRLRLHGVNTPEKRSKDPLEKELAKIAENFVSQMILDKDVLVQTYKDDSFGRYLARVYILSEGETKVYACLNDLLIESGLGVLYMEDTDLLE